MADRIEISLRQENRELSAKRLTPAETSEVLAAINLKLNRTQEKIEQFRSRATLCALQPFESLHMNELKARRELLYAAAAKLEL